MKKLVVTLFVVLFFSGLAFSQPTLTIVTETPGLPSELFYGTNCLANPGGCTKVKPVRMRPPGTPLPFWCVGAANTPITIDDCDFFAQQQYIDFLKRFPEAGPDNTYGTSDDPLRFYASIIGGCVPSDTECIKYSRGVVSANFFRSPEFQRKGNYVMYLYMVSIGQRPVTPAELSDTSKVDRPHYSEFMADLAAISTPNDDPVLTNQKKDQLAQNWMTRPEMASYPTNLTQFAQALATKAGVTLSSATQSAIASATTRAQVLRIVAESQEVDDKYFKQSFVTMEYFGYLRRDPENCTNSANWSDGTPNSCGYIFHNHRFTLHPDPDVIQNIIVRGFIESPEYRGRF
jgi:hypothetical protein